MTVSSSSTMMSAVGVMVTVAVVDPAAKETVLMLPLSTIPV